MNTVLDQQRRHVQAKGDVLRALDKELSNVEKGTGKKREEIELKSAKLYSINLDINVCNLKIQVQQKRLKEIRANLTETTKYCPMEPVRLQSFLKTIMLLQTRLASLPKHYDSSRIATEKAVVEAELLHARQTIGSLQGEYNSLNATTLAETINLSSADSMYTQILNQSRIHLSKETKSLAIAQEQHKNAETFRVEAEIQLAVLRERCEKLASRLERMKQRVDSDTQLTQLSWA